MAYKTIGVKVTGQAEVLAMTKLVNGLQKEVATVLKNIQTMGRQKPVAPFNVKLKIDTNDAVTQFIKLKKQLEKHTIDLKINGVSSGNSSSNTVVKGLGELNKQANTAVVSMKELNTEASKLSKPVKLGFFESLTKSKKELEETQKLLEKLDQGFIRALSRNLGDETSKNAIQALASYANLYARGKTRNQNPNAFRTEFRHFFPKTDSGYISFEKHNRKHMLNQLKAFKGVDDEYVEAFRQALKLGDEFENITVNIDNQREALRELREAVSSVTDGYTKLVKKAGELAVLKPAELMLKSFSEINKQVISLNMNLGGKVIESYNALIRKATEFVVVGSSRKVLDMFVALNREIVTMNINLGKGIGNMLISSVQTALGHVKSFVRQTIATLRTETEELGDAMEVYRLSMQSLGFSETETNLSMKRLGDYGKASVYDAKDLLALASNLYAYDRKDAEEIVKAIAGLTAQTKNPQGNFNKVQTQLVQMMGAGVLNQQDWKYMRDAMNALGQSEVIDAFEALAKQKGYRSVIEASRKRGITSEEVLDILKRIGNSDKFQNLVTSIITPKQAIANLKETLANLLVFDEIDDQGNAVDGPLKNLYDNITKFIKGITGVVSTAKFKQYTRNVGNFLGSLIGGVTKLGSTWNKNNSENFVKSLEKFGTDFKNALKGANFDNEVQSFTEELRAGLDSLGEALGKFSVNYSKLFIGFIERLSRAGRELAQGGILEGILAVIEMYNNLLDLSSATGLTGAFARQFNAFYQGINRILKNPLTAKVLAPLVNSLESFIIQLYDTVEGLAKTGTLSTTIGLFTSLTGVLEQLLDPLSAIIGNTVAFANTLRSTLGVGLFKDLQEVIGGIYDSLAKSRINLDVIAVAQEIREFLNITGDALAKFSISGVKTTLGIMRELVEVGTRLGQGGILDGFVAVGNVYKTILELANKTGLTQAFAKQFTQMFTTIEKILKDPSVKSSVTELVEVLGTYLTTLFSAIERLGTETDLIKTVLGVVTSLINTFTDIMESIGRRVSNYEFNNALSNIKKAVDELLEGLGKIYTEFISSVIETAGSKTFKKFLDAVVDLVLALNNAFLELFALVGDGNVQKGMEKVLGFFTSLIEVATSIVDKLGGFTFALPLIFSFGSWAINLITTLGNVWQALQTLGFAGGAGTGGAGLLGGLGGKLSTILNTPYAVAWNKALEKGKSIFQSGKGLASGAKNGLLSNIVKPFQYNYDEIVKQQLYVNKSQMYRGLNGAYDDLIKAMGPNLANNNYAKRLFTQGGASSKYVQNLFKSELATYGDDVAKILAEQSASNYAKVASPVAKLLNGGKAVGLTVGQAGMKGLASLGKSIPQLTKTLSSSMGTLKGTLITTAVNMGVGMLNDHVQNSDASDTAKMWSQIGTSALNIGSWALSGASFGPWGALAGGIIGAGLEAFNLISGSEAKKKAEEEEKAKAEAEAKQLLEERKAEILAYAQELASSARETQRNFFSTLSNNPTANEAFEGAYANILNEAQEKGLSVIETLASKGIELVPDSLVKTFEEKGLNNYELNIDGQVRTLAELMQETGLTAQETLGVLSYAYGTTGKGLVELKDTTDGSINTINSYVQAEKERLDKEMASLNEKMLGLYGSGGKYSNAPEIFKAEEELLKVQNTLFHTEEDAKNAYIKALSNGGKFDTTQLQNLSLDLLEGMAQRELEALQGYASTPEETRLKLLERLSKLKDIDKKVIDELEKENVLATLEEKVKAYEEKEGFYDKKDDLISDIEAIQRKLVTIEPFAKFKKELEEGSKALDEALKNGAEGYDVTGDKFGKGSGGIKGLENNIKPLLENIGIKSEGLRQAIAQKMFNTGMTLEEAVRAVTGDATTEDPAYTEALNQLKEKKQSYTQAVIDMVNNGTITAEEANKLLEEANINIKEVDLSNLDEESKKTAQELVNHKNEAEKKVKQTKEKAKSWLDNIMDFFSGIWNMFENNQPPETPSNPPKPSGPLSRRTTARTYSTGGFVGPVYRSEGGSIWKSRGTDTVPAMLTEGEYVLRKQAVNSLGLGLVQKLNHEGARALQNLSGRTIITNVYNNNNAKINQNIDNKSQYLNGMLGMDRLMRFV